MTWVRPPHIRAYIGPGDLVSGCSHFYGLRAYSRAQIGSTGIKVRENGGDTTLDVKFRGDGGLDIGALANFKGANSLFVDTLYDQIGSDHLVMATLANQPQFFIYDGPGGRPIMNYVNASNLKLATAGAVTVAQPLTWAVVTRNTANVAVNQLVVTGTVNSPEVYFSSTDNTIGLFAGSAILSGAFAQNNFYHAIGAVANGTSSRVAVNGHPGSLADAGATGQGGVLSMGVFGASTLPLDGHIMEAGIWPVALDEGQLTRMARNQRRFWKF